MAAKIVVDTSVLIKWVKTKDEDLVNEARHLLADIESLPLEVHVPALLLYEVGNVLLVKTDLDRRLRQVDHQPENARAGGPGGGCGGAGVQDRDQRAAEGRGYVR